MNWQEILGALLIGFPPTPEMIDHAFPLFLQRSGGLVLTLLITLLSMLIGSLMGTALALCRRQRTGAHGVARAPGLATLSSAIAATFVEIIRGLPIMLLVLLVFYVPHRITGLRIPGVVLAVCAFSLYAAVYLSEILRSGLRSIDPGLRSNARVLGLTPRQILWRIELPLVCRAMMPDLINLTVTVFKDTSTLAVVAVPELTYIGRQMLSSEPMAYELILLIILFLYWLPATLLTACVFGTDRRRLMSRAPA